MLRRGEAPGVVVVSERGRVVAAEGLSVEAR